MKLQMSKNVPNKDYKNQFIEDTMKNVEIKGYAVFNVQKSDNKLIDFEIPLNVLKPTEIN